MGYWQDQLKKIQGEKSGGSGGAGGDNPNPTISTVTQKAYDTFNAINSGDYKKNYIQDSYINGGLWKDDKTIDPRAGSVIANAANNGMANVKASSTAEYDKNGNLVNTTTVPSPSEEMRDYLLGKGNEYYANNDVSDSDLVYRYLYDQGLSDNDRMAVLGMLQDQEDANYMANPDYARWRITPNNITDAYNKVVYGDYIGDDVDKKPVYSGGYADEKKQTMSAAEELKIRQQDKQNFLDDIRKEVLEEGFTDPSTITYQVNKRYAEALANDTTGDLRENEEYLKNYGRTDYEDAQYTSAQNISDAQGAAEQMKDDAEYPKIYADIVEKTHDPNFNFDTIANEFVHHVHPEWFKGDGKQGQRAVNQLLSYMDGSQDPSQYPMIDEFVNFMANQGNGLAATYSQVAPQPTPVAQTPMSYNPLETVAAPAQDGNAGGGFNNWWKRQRARNIAISENLREGTPEFEERIREFLATGK